MRWKLEVWSSLLPRDRQMENMIFGFIQKKKKNQPTLHCGFIPETLGDKKSNNNIYCLLWCLRCVLTSSHPKLIPQYLYTPLTSAIMVRSEALTVISSIKPSELKRESERHRAHLSQETCFFPCVFCCFFRRVISESRRRLHAGDRVSASWRQHRRAWARVPLSALCHTKASQR